MPPASKWIRRLAWAGLAVLVIGVGAWLGVPPVLKSQAQERLGALLGRTVTIGEVEFSPVALSLTVRDIRIAGGDGDADAAPQLSVARLFVDAQWRSLVARAPVVEALQVDALKARVQRTATGGTDVDDVLARLKRDPDPADAASEPLRLALYNLELKDGELVIDDRVAGRRHTVGAVHLALPFLSTLPDDVTVTVQPRLAFTLNGAGFDTGAQAKPFAADRASRLSLRIDDLDLQPWLPYLPKTLPVRLQGGRLAADVGVAFAQPAGAAPAVGLSGSVRALDIVVADTSGGPLLAWQQLAVELADVRPLERQVNLGTVRLDGARALVRRAADGRLVALPAAAAVPSAAPAPAPASASASAAPPSSAGSGWQVRVRRVEVAAAQTDWIDETTRPATHWRFDGLQADAGPLHWPEATPATVRLSTGWHALGAAAPAHRAGATKASKSLHAAKAPQAPGLAPAPAAAVAPPDAGAASGGARITVDGTADPRRAALTLAVQALDLRVLAPYLAAVLQPTLDGRVNAQARLAWAGGPEPDTRLLVDRLEVDDLALREAVGAPASARPAAARATRPPPALGWKSLRVADAAIDLDARDVRVGSIELMRPEARMQRDREGLWSAQRWLVAAAPPAASTPATAPAGARPAAPAAPPWRLSLSRFQLDGGQLALDDALPAAEPVRLRVQGLRLAVRNAAWPSGPRAAPARVEVSARVLGLGPEDADVALPAAAPAGRPGRNAPPRAGLREPAQPPTIDWRGTVLPQPLAARGRLQVSRFPVHAFEPYFADMLPVSLRRAEAGYAGDLSVSQQPAGWAANLKGDALLGDVRVLSRASDAGDDAELLNWQSLAVRALDVAVVPGAKPVVDIGEVVLSDFFSRLVITADGRFNLRDVAAADGAAPPAGPPGAAPAWPASTATAAATASAPTTATSTPSAAAPASAPGPAAGGSTAALAPPASAAPAPGAGLPLVLSIGGVQLVNGRIDFTDRFVRPNFRTDLTELNGRLGAFRSDRRDMATLDLRGRAAGTALLEIRGSLNPTAKPLALDIQARATDLELAPLSPYAGKYAGYAIERGKLSVDLAYRIDPDGKLDAKNQVILNQLTFGEKIESPSATTLPVRLAVSLLTDRNGVIDINLPVSGSINDPQFSVFGIVLKVIGNLLVKALTAPFSLLAGGGTEDLSVIEFVPGTAVPTESGRAAIDKVAKALADRPALRMTVTGASDPAGERAAMQAATLEARVTAEHRRQALRAGAASDAPLPPMTAEDRQRAVRQLYADTKLPDKPRNLIGMVKDIPVPDMEARLLAATVVNTDTARELALQRSLAVRDALVARQLTSDRLFLAAPKLHAAGDDDKSAWTPRVQLSLSTQ